MSCSTASSSCEITEEHAKWFDLNLDRDLLDPNFNGYKLSLDTFPQYKLDLGQHDLDTYNLSDTETSNAEHHKMLLFQHLKLIGLQNLIVVNQFNDANVYYFDSKFRLVRVAYQGTETRSVIPTSLQLNLSGCNTNRVNVTMKFVNANTAAVFDGYETIYLFSSSASTDQWTELFRFSTKNLEKFGVACILKDAILLENNQLHLLFMNVQEKTEDNQTTGSFDTLINWLMFEPSSDDVWSMKRLRRLNCANSVPDYVALETNGASVFLAGVDTIRYEFDSVQPVKPLAIKQTKKMAEEMESSSDPIEKFYTWNQTVAEVNLSVCILEPGELLKSDLEIKVCTDSLEILHKGNVVIRDSFFGLVKHGESTWTLNASGHAIELALTKASMEIWPCCLKDMNKYGEYKEDEAQAESMDTSEKKITWEETQSLFRMEQQLEECDEINDEPGGATGDNDKMLMLRRMDGELHCATHKTYINDNKFLFDVRLSACKSPALCLRHDVDGILWQPHRITDTPSTSTVWLTHTHTFLAFGYVQASKTNTKFRSCAPNLSYACIADINKHLYVYRSVPADTQLKNRTTGKLINHIAKQYLISLDTDDEIYGLYCGNNFIIVLCSSSCYVYQINSN